MITTERISEVFNEDCMTGMARYPDGYFGLCVADPPYGIDFQSARRIERKRKAKIQNDESPFIDWIEPAYNKLNYSGALICFYRYDVQDEFQEEINRVGFKIKGQGVWDKVIHGMGDLKSGIAPRHELFIYAIKGSRTFPKTRPNSIITAQRCNPEMMIHPNEKPVSLYDQIFELYVHEGERVFDPFIGSGQSRIAAHKANIDFVGWEIDKDYFEAQEKRWKGFISQTRLF